MGKTEEEIRSEGVRDDLIAHKTFDGNRPSLSLLLPKLTAYSTGQLLAIYEHRTVVQGFLWDINSFDQWGVELGKKLAGDVKKHLLYARTTAKPVHTDCPSTSRILNYYIKNSNEASCDVLSDMNPLTNVRTMSSQNHLPPSGNDLAGSKGKLL